MQENIIQIIKDNYFIIIVLTLVFLIGILTLQMWGFNFEDPPLTTTQEITIEKLTTMADNQDPKNNINVNQLKEQVALDKAQNGTDMALIEPKPLVDLVKMKTELESLKFSPKASFCESQLTDPHGLDGACSELTRDNCMDTACCVWTSNKKCKAGNMNGATFPDTDDAGNQIPVDYYYYKNKLYNTGLLS